MYLFLTFTRPPIRLTNIHHGYSFDVIISMCFSMDPGAYGGRVSPALALPPRRPVAFATMPRRKVAIVHISRRVDHVSRGSPSTRTSPPSDDGIGKAMPAELVRLSSFCRQRSPRSISSGPHFQRINASTN